MMKSMMLAVAAALVALSSPVAAQTVDMSKFPAPAAGEFGPQAEVADGLSIANHVAVDGQAHTDGEGAPDVVGAFRFVCNPGQVNGDDSLIAPGVKGGAPHVHQAYGNKAWRYDSTYVSLRTTGTTGCAGSLNRTAYWLPALISGGKVKKFDHAAIYYKRFPKTSKYCNPADPAFVGECVGLPNNLHMIFGWDPVTGLAPTGSRKFKCVTGSANRGPFVDDMVTAAATCQPGDQLVTYIGAPECWDGVRLDSANHRDHVAYRLGTAHDAKCPSTHPKLIPHFEAQTAYTVDANLDRSGTWTPSTSTWYFSSDRMPGMAPVRPGKTVHQDYAEAWNARVKKAWIDNCIDRMLSCSGGQLGNGYYMKPDEPVAPPAVRDVPIPLLRGGNATLRGHVGHTM